MYTNLNDFQSADVANAAYEADWINGPPPMKTAIQMIVIRSQRPLKLTAIKGLITFNFETAIDVSCLCLTTKVILLFSLSGTN